MSLEIILVKDRWIPGTVLRPVISRPQHFVKKIPNVSVIHFLWNILELQPCNWTSYSSIRCNWCNHPFNVPLLSSFQAPFSRFLSPLPRIFPSCYASFSSLHWSPFLKAHPRGRCLDDKVITEHQRNTWSLLYRRVSFLLFFRAEDVKGTVLNLQDEALGGKERDAISMGDTETWINMIIK